MSTNKKPKQLNPHFIIEYKNFLVQYLFPILGIESDDSFLIEKIKYLNNDSITVGVISDTICFCASGWKVFELNYRYGISDDNLRLARRIIQAFFQVSKYKRTGSQIQNSYFSILQQEEVYKLAVQKGICYWIAGDNRSDRLDELISLLEKWSVKTYEGRSVTVGFIINPDEPSSPETQGINWIDFLQDDYAVVLTDCIHTVVELDQDCNFMRYLSVSENNEYRGTKLSNRVPLRFSQIIQHYLPKRQNNDKGANKVGIFLLTNGDILLAKDGAVCFVKRNLRWLNLSYDAFKNPLQDFVEETQISDLLLENVYASVLDVSFSHTGGIISIVTKDLIEEDTHISILDSLDDLLDDAPDKPDELQRSSNDISSSNLSEENSSSVPKENYSTDEGRRYLKRKILKKLISEKDFSCLDRKLRSELIALDGACILTQSGQVRSFGAIIRNDSGSTGGGRGAAAKKLSTYGIGIKISTDGYIELYKNKDLVYAIK